MSKEGQNTKKLNTKGISKSSNGYFKASFSKDGKRIQRTIKTAEEARNWRMEMEYQVAHNCLTNPECITVDDWFKRWIGIKEQTVRANTVRNYRERYITNIKPEIGHCLLQDLKPVQCQEILNQMAASYRSKTIGQVRTTMENMFSYAMDNDLILKNPAAKLVPDIGLPGKPSRVLTREEQRRFLSVITGHRFELVYRFALQTGMRCGEITGLKWSDIENGKIHVERTMEHRKGTWRIGNPKSVKGDRCIPLTLEAICILQEQKQHNAALRVIPMEWAEYVFLNASGEPTKAGTYDTALANICKRNSIEHFSMHTLRHTFATRYIESGMMPKTLQTILGHAKISITMNLYVHVTDDQMEAEMTKFAEFLAS